MNEESGDFEQVALQMDPADYYHIGVMSGTADQTEAVDVTASQEILLLGVFGEEGHGYLSLTFSKGRDGWAVRMVRFGLPAERDDARA